MTWRAVLLIYLPARMDEVGRLLWELAKLYPSARVRSVEEGWVVEVTDE